MNKYIVAIDIGSTNIKILIMAVKGETITEKYKTVVPLFASRKNFFINSHEIEKILIDILNENSIDIELIEVVLLTGSRSIEGEKIFNKKTIYIKEFDAIGMGGVILAHKNEGIVVNLGTGTTFVYSDINNNVYLGGTALGSGTFVGILSRVIEKEDINYFNLAGCGKSENVDLLMSDISKNGVDILKGDVTASNFGAVYKKYDDSDFAAGIINMIIENIGLELKYLKENILMKKKLSDIDVIFVGGFSKEEMQFATVIGAYEYYLIKMREVILNE